jgi:hypothetical protein
MPEQAPQLARRQDVVNVRRAARGHLWPRGLALFCGAWHDGHDGDILGLGGDGVGGWGLGLGVGWGFTAACVCPKRQRQPHSALVPSCVAAYARACAPLCPPGPAPPSAPSWAPRPPSRRRPASAAEGAQRAAVEGSPFIRREEGVRASAGTLRPGTYEDARCCGCPCCITVPCAAQHAKHRAPSRAACKAQGSKMRSAQSTGQQDKGRL